MPRTNDVQLRDFRPADLEEILALRERVFPGLTRERERRRWRWEFDENPFKTERAPIAWVFEQDGRIVGNYGLVPVPVAIDKKVELCFNGIDFAVAPELQGRGLGHQIAARHTDPELCPFPFLTAPTKAVAHLIEKHGGFVLSCEREPMLWSFACASEKPTPRVPREVALRAIQGFEPRFDELFHRVKERHRILVARDHRYLNWRYRDYPFDRPRPFTMVSAIGRDGLLRGFFVLQHERKKNHGYLAELFADPREEWVFHGLIAGAIDAARAAKMDELFALNRVPAVQELLRGHGFTRVETLPLEYTARLPTAPPGAAPFTAADWYLSPGDGDVLHGVGGIEG